MPYITPQDLIDEFGEAELIELTDRASPRAMQVDEAVAQGACDRATAAIDAALGLRYVLPLAAVPPLLRYLALDLARYHLHDAEPPEQVKKRFDVARQTLRDLQNGTQSLGAGAAGVPAADASSNLCELVPGGKVFGRDTGMGQ